MANRVKMVVPAVVAALMMAAPAANAGLLDPVTQVLAPVTQVVLPTCGSTVYPFRQFGDSNGYYGFANNGFENGPSGWSLAGGAYAGFGNEPWYANGWGMRSLALPPGASATSPAFCINLLDPALRAFARGSAGGNLQIQVLFRGVTGNLLGILNYGSVSGTGSWAPTSRVASELALPLLTSYAQVRVTSASGSWNLDDVFEDPSVCLIG